MSTHELMSSQLMSTHGHEYSQNPWVSTHWHHWDPDHSCLLLSCLIVILEMSCKILRSDAVKSLEPVCRPPIMVLCSSSFSWDVKVLVKGSWVRGIEAAALFRRRGLRRDVRRCILTYWKMWVLCDIDGAWFSEEVWCVRILETKSVRWLCWAKLWYSESLFARDR